MFDSFEKYLKSYIELSREALDLIEGAAVKRNLRKKHFLTREGKIFSL